MVVRVLLVEDALKSTGLVQKILNGCKNFYLHVSPLRAVDQPSVIKAQQQTDVIILVLDIISKINLTVIPTINKNFPNIPVVIISEDDNAASALAAANAGVQAYLLCSQVNDESLPRALRFAIGQSSYQLRQEKPEGQYALAVTGARDGLWDWDLIYDQVYYSARWKNLLGYQENEIGFSVDEWFKRVHPSDLPKLKQEIDNLQSGKVDDFENEHRIRTRENSYRWMLVQGVIEHDKNNAVCRIAGSMTDVTERHQADDKFAFEVQHDALTYLPNRNYFSRLMNRTLGRMEGNIRKQFAVLFLNVDRYQTIKDSLGHLVGDQLLIAFARRLEMCLRPGDTVARLGEDEFALFLDHINNIHETTRIADRVLQGISEPFNINGHEIVVSTGIGIVMSISGYERAEDMLRDADLAMYQAAIKGKSCFEIFDQTMNDLAQARETLNAGLHKAIELDEISVDYQPIISLSNGQITGFEALARWRHEDKDIPPLQFIRAAEENGMIMSIGEYVLKSACNQLRAWQKAGLADDKMTISVNISGKQLVQSTFQASVVSILKNAGIKGKNIIFEITESAVLENSHTVIQTLQSFKKMGITCAMDDFGLGYASLSNLHQLPIDTLKVDRSFISGQSGENRHKIEMLKTIITMAHSMGLRVIAEGVEDRQLLEKLKSYDCEYAQGYYFSPPVNAINAEKMLYDLPLWGSSLH